MEIADPSAAPARSHVWLQRLGLQEPPPDASSWVPVVRALGIDDRRAHTSKVGSRLVDALAQAGIDAHQRAYEHYSSKPGTTAGIPTAKTEMLPRVAVLVHSHDLTRAVEIATRVNDEIGQEAHPQISDQELTRQALDAGQPPPE